MSNDSSGFPSVDNLTPFEYALAGVEPPDARHSPSLSVIQQMRRLAAEVDDAPIAQPALRDLIRNGGIISRRNDRRSIRRKRPTTAADAAAIGPDEGGFVDITPIELSEDPLDREFVLAGEDSSPTTDDSFAALAAGFGQAAPEAPIEPKPAELARLDHAIVQAQALLANDKTNADSQDVENLDEDESTDPDDGPTDADVDVSPGHRLSDDDLTVITSAPESESFFVLDDGTELPMVTGGELATAGDVQPQDDIPSLFPTVADGADFHFTKSGGQTLAAEAAIGSDEDESDEGAILVGVGAGAAAAGLHGQGGEAHGPPVVADPLAAYNGLEDTERRRIVGGAFWALAGTAAAAAVLVLGGLWWANTLRDRTETDSAAAPTTLGELGEEENGTVGSESSDAEDDASAGSDPDGLDADESSGTGDFGQQDPTSPERSSGTDSTATTTGSNDRNTPSTTASNVSGTTVGEATTVPKTTQAPQITDDETTTTTQRTTTTEAPATTAAPRPTVPASVAPTVPALAFIGDSVNIGSFGGPGASGVRVDLFEDLNGNGQGDRFVEFKTTPQSGRYAFNVPAGCYVVQFNSIPGFDVDPGLASQPVCVDPGEASARVDGVLFERQAISRPPDGCFVEDSSNSLQGVEVYENSSDWADSYIFYANNGSIVYRTPREPHDVDGNSNDDYEWTGEAGGFDVRSVRSVAASRGGVVSEAIRCVRE